VFYKIVVPFIESGSFPKYFILSFAIGESVPYLAHFATCDKVFAFFSQEQEYLSD